MGVLSTGGRVDRFEVEALLGRGGLAEVYRVRHEVLGSRYALKVVTVKGSAVGRRLLREGRIQSQLRHPNIVAVNDVIEFDGHVALVLEYVEGCSLEQWVRRTGPMELVVALEFFAQVLAGVTAAHDAGVLHRDLKPGNVMLAPSSAGVLAKVTDFGIAKVLVDEPGAGETMQGLVMGTPGYMAPEQAQDSSTVDRRADLFALGAILYEMLTGAEAFVRHDFASTMAATLDGHFTPVSELRPEVPAQVEHVVNCLLRVEPEARFADGRATANALFGEGSRLAEIVAGKQVATPLMVAVPAGLEMMPAGLSLSGAGKSSAGATPRSATPMAGETMVPGAATQVEAPVTESGRARWAAAFAAFLLMGSVGLIALLIVQPGLDRASSPASEPPAQTAAVAPKDEAPVAHGDGGAVAEPAPAVVAPSASAPEPVAARARPELIAKADPAEARPAPEVAPAAVEPVAPPEVAPPTGSAAPAPAEPVAATAAAVVAAAPDVAGTWKGNWGGRPLTLRISGADESLKAELDVLVGTAYRTWSLRGRVSSDGTLSLSGGSGSDAWMVNGKVSGGKLDAMVMQGTDGKPSKFSATRK